MPCPGASIARRLLRVSTVGLIVVAVLLASEVDVRAGARQRFAAKLRFGPGIVNHPVHVRPSVAVAIPEGWPLDPDGTITCSTCHHALPSLEGPTEYLLREFDDDATSLVQFCRSCHDNGNQRIAANSHWLAVGVAHIRDNAHQHAESRSGLDAESRSCLGCHDGVSATEHTISPADRGRAHLSEKGQSHPIGVPYEGNREHGKSPALRPRALLPDKVRLPGGSVSCVSCHNLYVSTPSRLVVPIEESRLCLTCHDMD